VTVSPPIPPVPNEPTRRPVHLAAAAVLAVGALSAFLVVAAVLARTLIPYEVHADVVAIDERNHNSRGSDVWLVQLDDGREYFVDDVAAATLVAGYSVDKDAWSREVAVAGTTRRIGVSREAWGPAAWSVVVLGLVAFRVRQSTRSRPSVPSSPGWSAEPPSTGPAVPPLPPGPGASP
jgi:hypothetical protein